MILGWRNLAPLALVATVAISSCAKPASGPAGPHFGKFCVQQKDWPTLIVLMKRYAAAHALGFHGEVTRPPSGPIFNYYLARGYSYYLGDDFDLWITSDPFSPGEMDLNGPVKHKPITQEQIALGRGLIAAIKGLSFCGITAAE
jgi:hypothetical protein